MPSFDDMRYDQKWSLWDTWASVGRRIKLAVITTQYRFFGILTAQYRLLNVIKAQYRNIRGQTGG